jgi:predicted anti-sigma-YlaC factor YlaD
MTLALTCRELVELVSDYLDDRLSSDERMRFEEHLAVCGPCRIYLHQLRETIRLSGELPREGITPSAQAALLASFRGWKR